MRITGTFLDEITHDISAQNWGPEEWAREFDTMQATGIDTVILIRAGYRERMTFPSRVLARHARMMPCYLDLVKLFLSQADRCGMTFFFGTYDSGAHWVAGRYTEEVAINKEFCREVVDRYGHHMSFGGWYISHEINTFDPGVMTVYEDLSAHLRSLKPLPILISPYIRGAKQFGDGAITLAQHRQEWESVFTRLEGIVDIVAFQDGNVPLELLPEYLETNRTLAAAHGIRSWSNVESFDRDVHIKFPPIDHRKLRYKVEQAAQAGMEKLITFEFSHFMSPNADHPAARSLYRRYMEWTQGQNHD
ncbi:MAG: DUF4434 domain-containing protein [Phycisphaerae bacterium]